MNFSNQKSKVSYRISLNDTSLEILIVYAFLYLKATYTIFFMNYFSGVL